MRAVRTNVVALSLALLLSGCDGATEHTSAEYVTQAQSLIEQGDLAAGAIELKNALRQDPENAQARWLLGKLHLETGNGPAAEKELSKARELGVLSDSVLPPLARAYLLQQKYDEVLKLPPPMVASPSARADLLAWRGMALLQQGKREPAAAEFQAALQQDQNSKYALLGQAQLSAAQGDLSGARRLIETIQHLDGGFAPAWDLLGDIESAANNPEQALQAYTEAVEKQPHNNIAYLLKRVLVRAQLKQFEAAQADIALLQQHAPKHPGIAYARGLLNYHQGHFSQAQEAFELALRDNRNNLMATLYLGFTHHQLGNPAQAERLLSEYLERDPYYIPAVRLLAHLKLGKGDYREAERLIRPVVQASEKDTLALNLLANALLAQGKPQEATALLEQAAALEPESATAQTRLGLGMLIQGDQGAGIERLETAAALDPDQERADYLLILTHLRTKSFDQALQAAKSTLERHPESAMAYNMLGLSHMALQQEAEAKQAFERAAALAPGDPAANQNLASLALRDSKPEAARDYYNDILAHHKDDLDTLMHLAALEDNQGRRDAMTQALERAMAAHPDALEPRLSLARHHLQEDRPGEVLILLREAIEKNPDHPAVLAILGEAQLASRDPINAKASLTRALSRAPGAAQLHFLLAQTHILLNDRPAATTALDQALALAPDHLPARVAKGRWLVLDGHADQAEQHLSTLKKTAPEHPDVLLLEGEIAAALGQTDRATTAFRHALEKGRQNKYLLALSDHLWRTGKQDAALAQLEEWRKEHPRDIAVLLSLAMAKAGLKRDEEAIAHYSEILKLSDQNLAALNDLAWLLRDTNPGKALEYGERAYRIAPEAATVMDTLAVVLLKNDKPEQARRMIERALAKDAKNPAMRYHHAMILNQIGQRTEAKTILRGLLAESAPFGERSQAQTLFESL